jgi:hypothetical protein
MSQPSSYAANSEKRLRNLFFAATVGIYFLAVVLLIFRLGSIASVLNFSCFSSHDGKYMYRVAMNLVEGKSDSYFMMIYWYERFGLPLLTVIVAKAVGLLTSMIPGIPQTFETPTQQILPIRFFNYGLSLILIECVTAGIAVREFIFLLQRKRWSPSFVVSGAILFVLSPVLWFGVLNSLEFPLTLAGVLFLYNRKDTLSIPWQITVVCLLCTLRQTNIVFSIFPFFAAWQHAGYQFRSRLIAAALSGIIPLGFLLLVMTIVKSRYQLSVSDLKNVANFAFSWPFAGAIHAVGEQVQKLSSPEWRVHLLHLAFLCLLFVSVGGWASQTSGEKEERISWIYFSPVILMVILLNHIGFVAFFQWGRVWFQMPPAFVGLFFPFWRSEKFSRTWTVFLIAVFILFDIHTARFVLSTSGQDDIGNIPFLLGK